MKSIDTTLDTTGNLVDRLFSSFALEVTILGVIVVLILINIVRFREYKVKANLVDLFYIAGINLLVRRARSFVTIIGMSIGIASIVFLVSIGYGLQNMVVSQATKLEELKYIEVYPQQGSKLKLDDSILNDFMSIPNVDKALPMVSLVGDLSYQSSNVSIPVYGVTTDYLEESALQPIAGNMFESRQIYYQISDNETPTINNNGSREGIDNSNVTGNASLLEEPLVIDESEFIEIETESVTEKEEKVKELKLPTTALREIIVNNATLEIIGLDLEKAIGSQVKLIFTIPNNNLKEEGIKIVSYPEIYTIVSVLQDSAEPVIYAPFYNFRMLEVTNFSEIRVISNSQDNVSTIREQIESQGYVTSSTLDTLAEVDSLFRSLRVGLGFIGVFGLTIASLGMFNTLTVSLLERTREIGLMKTIGMKSTEVRLLFLIESLLMGVLGGLIGLVIGFLGGKIISLILTSYSITKGGGVINVSSIPIGFGVLVIALSAIVGYFTGIFPARRATKISALNALRYE